MSTMKTTRPTSNPPLIIDSIYDGYREIGFAVESENGVNAYVVGGKRGEHCNFIGTFKTRAAARAAIMHHF